MSDRKNIQTTIPEIVDYWVRHEDECGLSVDFSEAHERCWRCGCERKLERCHIVPDPLGGPDTPSNFVLLCHRCHLDNPNVADPEIMWDWLRAYAVPFYDTFWAIQGSQEYQQIYGISLKEELLARGLTDASTEEFMDIYREQFQKASFHFGDPHLNIATIAGIFRMTLKEYDRRHGLETSHTIRPHINLADYL